MGYCITSLLVVILSYFQLIIVLEVVVIIPWVAILSSVDYHGRLFC